MSDERQPHLRLVDPPAPTASPTPSATASTEQADDELLVLARGGDRPAFVEIVRRHQHRVVAFATRFFGQHAVALDVAQDVFLDVMKALQRYRPEGRFTVWLYRITLNRCRMTARAVRYEHRVRDRLFVERQEQLPHDESAARDREQRLRRALVELPEKHRAVLQLRFWGGLSHEEIAAVLETKEGTVKSRMWNALASLREKLGETA